jgi:hypothetical protein
MSTIATVRQVAADPAAANVDLAAVGPLPGADREARAAHWSAAALQVHGPQIDDRIGIGATANLC